MDAKRRWYELHTTHKWTGPCGIPAHQRETQSHATSAAPRQNLPKKIHGRSPLFLEPTQGTTELQLGTDGGMDTTTRTLAQLPRLMPTIINAHHAEQIAWYRAMDMAAIVLQRHRITRHTATAQAITHGYSPLVMTYVDDSALFSGGHIGRTWNLEMPTPRSQESENKPSDNPQEAR